MKDYNNLVEALNDLKKRGYVHDFNLQENAIVCDAIDQVCTPKDFTIEEMYRFEQMSDVGDESILYALVTKSGEKGVLIDAYGTYSETLSTEMRDKLKYDPK